MTTTHARVHPRTSYRSTDKHGIARVLDGAQDDQGRGAVERRVASERHAFSCNRRANRHTFPGSPPANNIERIYTNRTERIVSRWCVHCIRSNRTADATVGYFFWSLFRCLRTIGKVVRSVSSAAYVQLTRPMILKSVSRTVRPTRVRCVPVDAQLYSRFRAARTTCFRHTPPPPGTVARFDALHVHVLHDACVRLHRAYRSVHVCTAPSLQLLPAAGRRSTAIFPWCPLPSRPRGRRQRVRAARVRQRFGRQTRLHVNACDERIALAYTHTDCTRVPPGRARPGRVAIFKKSACAYDTVCNRYAGAVYRSSPHEDTATGCTARH